MNQEKKTEIKVGVTVILALIIFVFIYGWAKNYSFNSETNTISIKFTTVSGLEIGDMTTINGVKKGYVTSINAMNNNALVKVEFNEKVDLRKDAIFQIMMLDLMGGKKIEIYPGVSNEQIDMNKTQLGKFAGDVSTVMATLNSVESDLITVIGELKNSLTIANDVLSEDDFKYNIKNSVKQLNNITTNLNQFIVNNKENIEQTLENTKNITDKTYKILSKNSESIDSVFTNLNYTLNASQKLFKKIELLVSQTENKENNLGKILYDDKILNDLKISLNQLKELTTTINKQLNSEGLKVKADVDIF